MSQFTPPTQPYGSDSMEAWRTDPSTDPSHARDPRHRSRRSLAVVGGVLAALLILGAAGAYAWRRTGQAEVSAATASTPTVAPTTARGYPPSMEGVLRQLGCTEYQPADSLAVYEAGEAQCVSPWEGLVSTFGTRTLRDQYLAMAQGFGGAYVVGELWIAAPDDPADADHLADVSGGHRA